MISSMLDNTVTEFFIENLSKYIKQLCILYWLLYSNNDIFNSCNMGISVLPDMYTRIPRAAGPRDEGVHIRQNTTIV